VLTSRDERAISISGTTLKVYVYMLKAGRPVGVREVQRALGFKSPSTALYHISKLVDHGLAVKEGDGYRAISTSSISTLVMFKRLGRLMVPRLFFYAIFFTISTILFSITALLTNTLFSFSGLFALIMCILASAFMWIETIRLWKRGLT